ncbi:MAG: ComEC/Rec2 family competence protein [Candidatus Paceibacterota bacterium]
MNTTHTKTVTFVAGVMLGIVCGEVSSFSTEVAMSAGLLAVVQGGIYFWERKRKQASGVVDAARLFSFSLMTMLFSLGLFVGIIRAQLVEEKNNFVCESTCSFDAKIVSSPEIKNDVQTFRARPLEMDDVYDVQVRAQLYPKYQIGETLKISGKVKVPDVIQMHGDKNNSFDYASYLKTKNVGSEMSYPKVEVIDESAKTFSDTLGRWKENFVTRIDLYVSSPASSLASGMLFGASSMSKDLSQTFRTAGLSHIVVLSGFNIVIVIATILFLFSFLPLILRITFAAVSVVAFVIVVGAEPSVIRATLMAFVSLLAMVVGREYVARDALIISLFAIVMYEPYALTHDASLHLSFLATAGIVYLMKPLEEIFVRYFSSIKSKTFKEIFVTSLAAYIATMPYIMYAFGTVSVYALMANILILPFVPLAMLLSFLVVVSSFILVSLSQVIGFMDTAFIDVMIWIARAVEGLPMASIQSSISFKTMSVVYVCIMLGIIYFSTKNKNETRVTIENGNLTDIISY